MWSLYEWRDMNPEAMDMQIDRLRSKLASMDPERLEQFDRMRRSMVLPS